MGRLAKVSTVSLGLTAAAVAAVWLVLWAQLECSGTPSAGTISGRVLTMDDRGIGGAKVYAYHQIGDPHASQIDEVVTGVKVTEGLATRDVRILLREYRDP